MTAEATVLLGPLQSLLGWFQKNRMHKDEQKDAALEAINKALFASMKYARNSASQVSLIASGSSNSRSCGQMRLLGFVTQAMNLRCGSRTNQCFGPSR